LYGKIYRALNLKSFVIMEFIKKSLRSNFILKEGIFSSKISLDTTVEVSEFYKTNPFPNFNDFKDKNDLSRIVEKNSFLKDLKSNIGFGKKFIEVGSGTCQLSLALADKTNNFVIAFDPTKASLELGRDYAKSNKIKNVIFLNADIFDDPCENAFFDYVWCSGVLHHTKSPKKGFEIISNWVKPNGLIIIGLYNNIGRLRTNFRQIIYKLMGKSKLSKKLIFILDPHLRKDLSEAKKTAWFRDQYEHPVESKHSIDEVIKWFDENNISFLGSIPSTNLEVNTKIKDMDGNRGSFFTRIYAQISMLFSPLGAEGGLFLVIGKRK